MSIIEAIILGIFQGITEFLPISSSGHLVLLQNLFGIEEDTIFFTVMLHFGTLLSIFIIYFKDIINIVIEFFKMIHDIIQKRQLNLNEYRILAIMIIIGSIPTGLMGIFLKDYFEGLYNSLFAIGISFIITGFILFITEKIATGKKNVKDLRVIDAIIIGVFQGMAITPGISRSGSTIVGGLLRGFNKKLATKFSFLLALPAIFGATLLNFVEVLSSENYLTLSTPLVIGTTLSAITGIAAIKLLIKLLERGKLYYFSFYLWILGAIVIIYSCFS